MRLKRKLCQTRRDFKGLYECENCGHTIEAYGYDDRFFHDKVSPQWICKQCGESSLSLGTEEFIQTKYNEWEVV